MERYYNPFGGMDINIPLVYHESFQRYCQRTAGIPIDQSPFPRMVDLWFLAMCVAVRRDLAPASSEGQETVKIMDGSIFNSDPWRVRVLLLVGIAKTGDPEVVATPRRVMSLANGLALAGIPEVIAMLKDGSGDPIWNLSDEIHSLMGSGTDQ